MSAEQPFRVVIAGGGVAALEGALALAQLAGERVALTLLAPDAQFTYRPMSVGEPFSFAPARRYPLAELAAHAGARLLAGSFAWVDPDARVAHAQDGTALPYDALLLGLGARVRAPFAHALTLDDRRMDQLLHGLVQDVEGGYVRSIAFVAPPRIGWPLPLYELALLTARRAFEMGVTVEVTIVTPEPAPLHVFGAEVSEAVAQLLAQAGIATALAAQVQIPEPGHVLLGPDGPVLAADRVIALPELFGPSVRGLPAGEHGFIAVDEHCQVTGVPRVYAAGDATDFPIKLGGIAAQQADVAAQAIAALAGALVSPAPLRAEIHGVLLTGTAPRVLRASIASGAVVRSEMAELPDGPPPPKIAARYLAPYLESR